MTQAPIPGPLKYIPEGDGGGRDPDGPAPDLGTVDANDYGYGTVGNMGMTEEEQADVDPQQCDSPRFNIILLILFSFKVICFIFSKMPKLIKTC